MDTHHDILCAMVCVVTLLVSKVTGRYHGLTSEEIHPNMSIILSNNTAYEFH